MEGAGLLWGLTTIVAVAGLAIAVLALVRVRSRGIDRPPGGTASDGEEDWLERRLDALEAAVQDLAGRPVTTDGGPARGRGLGLVRFDAFEDTGGARSFALALLDEVDDGVILSSLHSRQATRLYVKRVTRGTPDLPLSGEEALALEQARSRFRRTHQPG